MIDTNLRTKTGNHKYYFNGDDYGKTTPLLLRNLRLLAVAILLYRTTPPLLLYRVSCNLKNILTGTTNTEPGS